MYISADGRQFQKRYGNRVAVWEGVAFQTSSGLKREDLKENRRGRIVSIRRSALMLERYKSFGGLMRKVEEHKAEKAPEEEKLPEEEKKQKVQVKVMKDRKAPVLSRRRH